VLSGKEIRYELEAGGLNIERRDNSKLSIEPSSIDLHLGNYYGKYSNKNQPVKVWKEQSYPDYWVRDCREMINRNGAIPIEPGEFILAHTDEVVDLPEHLVGVLEGRSSVGRLGIAVENAGLVDAGFSGDLTLELKNQSKNEVWLKPGMRIVQMTMYEHRLPSEMEYSEENGNKYQGQSGPTPTRLYRDFEEEVRETDSISSSIQTNS